MAQDGYKTQWGEKGRDDFGIMRRIGANFIRLYHPIGEEDWSGAAPRPHEQPNHQGMLDAAHRNGLQVFGAIHQYRKCDGDDCSESWQNAVRSALQKGFSSDGAWHPAAWGLNMINEVDAIVPFDRGDRQVKRIISAVDGLLAAEKELGVKGTVNLTSCFTTAITKPLGPGPSSIYHGFNSMENWIKNTSLVDYKPRSGTIEELAKAIDSRWVHCINAQIPWIGGLDGMVAKQYAQQGFLPRPWILGEMGWNGQHQDVIELELATMHEWAKGPNGFLGTFFFQFQTAYQKTGPELNYGMFGLSEQLLDLPSVTVEGEEKSFPVHCLTSRLYAFEQPSSACQAECNHRAQAVAKAFGGELSGMGLCLDDAPMAPSNSRGAELIVHM